MADVFNMRDERGAEDEFVGFSVHKIDQAGVTGGDPRGQTDNLPEHFVEGAL
jgi:hypothetical protein